MRSLLCTAVICLLASAPVRAGLHYSGEEFSPLPSQWRGFLLDQRQLRLVAFPGMPKTPATALRVRYEKAAAELEKTARSRALSADERADLGAILVRLGNLPRALTVLREAHGLHPRHYRITSNLGTAWQMSGELDQAEVCLREAVRLAPGNLQRAEEYQLKLLGLRRREGRGEVTLDKLLDARFVNDTGEYEPGKLATSERKKLPAAAVADLQMLALWLPADGRLLWLLAELAAVHGDVRTAAAIMDGCVTEFALRSPELRRHRQAMREAADKLGKMGPTAKADHEMHPGTLKTRSRRPLIDREGLTELPPIKADAVNVLPWSVVTQTTVDRQYKPTFPTYLRELEGKQVRLKGFMQPLGDDLDQAVFLLIEYPVGCWYCESPDVTAIVLVEMPTGKSRMFSRESLTITGRLKLNTKDPEDFLFKVTGASVENAE